MSRRGRVHARSHTAHVFSVLQVAKNYKNTRNSAGAEFGAKKALQMSSDSSDSEVFKVHIFRTLSPSDSCSLRLCSFIHTGNFFQNFKMRHQRNHSDFYLRLIDLKIISNMSHTFKSPARPVAIITIELSLQICLKNRFLSSTFYSHYIHLPFSSYF